MANAHCVLAEISWLIRYPSVFNDSNAVAISRRVMKVVCGNENIIEMKEPMLGAEDLAVFSEIVPSSMQFIGVHHIDLGKRYPLHHPKLNIDEDALKYGVAYFVGIAEELVF